MEPVWSRDSREIFYWNGDQLYPVGIESERGETFQHGAPIALFERAHRPGTFSPGYDVASDGQRFLIVEGRQAAISQLDVVLNWHGELLERAPVN